MKITQRQTRIVATLGPSSSSAPVIRRLIRAGMNVARLNFAHAKRSDLKDLVTTIRKQSAATGVPVAILGDLAGPKLRTGPADQAVSLRRGACVQFYDRVTPTSAERLGVDCRGLTRHLEAGHRVLVDDGRIRMRVEAVHAHHAVCRVSSGGALTARRGVNLPDTQLGLPALTAQDRRDLEWSVAAGLDLVSLSFVRSGRDLTDLRRAIRHLGADIPLIAKIEKPEALAHLEEILREADGVMVARGDLGVELSAEEVPLAQKRILAEARAVHVPTIVATEMLESMIESQRPTRAEASDVANAVLDGADALMLSGETAVGRHPVETVQTMHRIAEKAEEITPPGSAPSGVQAQHGRDHGPILDSAAAAAVEAARALDARWLVCYTESGRTARVLSQLRPRVPIVAFTSSERMVRRMALYRGVWPVRMKPGRNYDATLRSVIDSLLNERRARRGDLVVMLSATPIRKHAEADTIKLLRLDSLS